MASSAQTRANRRNAKKSTGPKSAGGRRASSQNAKRHGITGKAEESDIYAAAASLGLGGDAGDPQSLKLAAAQSKRRAAIKTLIGSGQCTAAPLI